MSSCQCEWGVNGVLVLLCDEHRKYVEDACREAVKEAKPLRWRTGPVPEADINTRFLVKVDDKKVVGVVKVGWEILPGDRHIPLSDILAMVEG